MNSRVAAAAFASLLFAAPLAAMAQPSNQGPIERPKAGATNTQDLGKARDSSTRLPRTSRSPMGPSDNDPAHPETNASPDHTR